MFDDVEEMWRDLPTALTQAVRVACGSSVGDSQRRLDVRVGEAGGLEGVSYVWPSSLF
jgi:hypothetical protein